MTEDRSIEESDPVSMVAGYLKYFYNDKKRFLSDLVARLQTTNQRVGKSVSARESYEHNVRSILDLGLEKEFARAFLDEESIGDWAQISARAGMLDPYSKNELLALAELLKEMNPEWTPERKTKEALLRSILRQYNDETLGRAISAAVERRLVEPIVTGNGFVLGPLGIMKLQVQRNGDSEFLIDSILDEFIAPDKSYELAKAIPINIDQYALLRDDPLLSQKVRQLIMSGIDDTQIFQAVGKLIATEIISVSRIVPLGGDAVLSPFGVLMTGDNPIDGLADVVVSNVSGTTLAAHLQAYGISTNNLKQGIVELCFREKPEFFRRFFGLDQLKSIGAQLGFVNTDKVIVGEEAKLWEAIMAKLGFSVPSRPTGITAFSRDLQSLRTEVAGMTILSPASVGTRIIGPMMQAYAMCERVLKDLVYFYSVVIGSKTDMDNLDTDEMNNWIAEKLHLDDNTRPKLLQNRLTFGEWVGILRLLDKYVRARTDDGALARDNLKRNCHRETLLSGCSLRALENASATRNLYRHDTGEPIPSVNDSLETLDTISAFLTCLVNNHVYPTLMRIVREVRDEFGLVYYEIEEESGGKRSIQGRDYLPTGTPLAMPSSEEPLPKDAPVIELFWRPA